MSKFNLTSLISNSCLMSLIAVGYLSTPAKSASANIKLTTEPALEKIVPYEAEAESPQKAVKLTLQASDNAGKPLTNVRMQVKLHCRQSMVRRFAAWIDKSKGLIDVRTR